MRVQVDVRYAGCGRPFPASGAAYPQPSSLRAKSGLPTLERQMADSLSSPPFRRLGPDQPATPVVLSVPHAGRDYSHALLDAARLSRLKLEALEDRLVPRRAGRAVAAGAVAFIAGTPRAETDLSRDEREVEPAMVVPRPAPSSLADSPRTRGGLGLV